MNSLPDLETVHQAVFTLYNNADSGEKTKASMWLEELQKSVYAWKISDEILRQQRDPQLCYFAAFTMRKKIESCFHELPTETHTSLRDSLIDHISQIEEQSYVTFVPQLCIALADLALQMTSWDKPILDLITRFGGDSKSLWPLLEIMKVIPEETNRLEIGANRREHVLMELKSCADAVTEFLTVCLKNNPDNIQVHTRILCCLTSWITVKVVSLQTIPSNAIVAYAFQVLSNHMAQSTLHTAATECICAILQVIEIYNKSKDRNRSDEAVQLEQLQLCFFTSVSALEQPYHMSVAYEEPVQSLNYCRIFTELAETYLMTTVNESISGKPHYSVQNFDLVLMGVSHYEYEVAQITFNLWYQLSEELYQRNNKDLNNVFRPYIEKLIGALCKHCQMEPDHLGLPEDGNSSDDFVRFRHHVSELIKDVVFVVGSSHCFRQMFSMLTAGGTGDTRAPTWDSTEAALFIMQAVAKNILPEEDEVVPKVVEAILNVPENTHIAVKHTSVILLGELCEWINSHPQSLEPALNFLLSCLNQKGLASAAAGALHSICTACPEHMSSHFQGLLHIARCLDNFPLSNKAAIGLLNGVSIILARLPHAEITPAMKELCWFQSNHLCKLMESAQPSEITRGTNTDPVVWLDRLATIFRHTNPRVNNDNQPHPCREVITEMWPVLSKVCNAYHKDARIIERCCRCLRYAVRCIGLHAIHLLESIVKQIVHLYVMDQHSCFLYLGSILVDEYAADHDCAVGLVQMLEAFIGPTFTILQEDDGLRNHPETVDDLFRLCARFLQRAPIAFLRSAALNSIVDCALMACSLDHKDANASVMKFFYDLLHCGRNHDERSDFTIRRHLIQGVVQEKGPTLVRNLIHAFVFSLSISMLQDVADVLIELNLTDSNAFSMWLEEAIKSMPNIQNTGRTIATPAQLSEFHNTLSRTTDSPKKVTHALENFARLFH